MSEDLIKRSDAIKVMACEMYAEAQSQGYEVDSIEDFMPEAKAWITDAPSIDICFCRECKYSEKATSPITALWCKRFGLKDMAVEADDFCSYGERKGDA